MSNTSAYVVTHAPAQRRSEQLRPQAGGHTIAAAVFIVVFLLRWVTLRFDNDHFMHLAWAAEMLHGDWPVRDYVEPGFILQTLLSSVAFAGSYQLFGEGLVVCTFVAAGAALTYLACRRGGVGALLALAVVACAVCAYPRTYAYPKAFVYPAALWAIAAHAAAPSRRTLTLLGVVTAIAFLFRPDHGLWIACAGAIALVIMEWGSWTRLLASAVRSGGIAALIAAPWIVWVAASGHAKDYVADLSAAQSVTAWRPPDTSLTFDTSAPLVTMAPVAFPRIAIRWAKGTSATTRTDRERRYGLQPIPNQDQRYWLTDLDRSNVRALVLDPAVEDTNDIDRRSFQVTGGRLASAYVFLQEHLPVIRVRLLTGAIRATNALTWLTWVSFALPFVVLAAALIHAVRQRFRPPPHAVDQRRLGLLISAAVLAVLAYQGLVRGSPDSRLGDVAPITAVLLAFATRGMWRTGGWIAILTRPVAVVLLMLTLFASVSYGMSYGRLGDVDLATLTELRTRITETYRLYARRPLDIYAGPGATGLDRLSRWLNACTPEQSRVAIVGFEPQVFVVSERGFAGGLAFIYEGWNASERGERLALTRWSHQDVPVVLAVQSEWQAFSRDYPLIKDMIDRRYRPVGRSKFGGNKEIAVFVQRTSAAVRIDSATRLPCFR